MFLTFLSHQRAFSFVCIKDLSSYNANLNQDYLFEVGLAFNAKRSCREILRKIDVDILEGSVSFPPSLCLLNWISTQC